MAISALTETGIVPSTGQDELVRRAQQGDRAAFDALYALCAGRVFAVLLRMCGSREHATRLTQDTFVAAWRSLDTFRADSRFTSWLHRIAVNAALHERRTDSRREARVIAVDPALLEGATAALPHELRLDLERAIASLPPGARDALVLHDIHGYTHEEIAAMCGIAPGTVKSQLHRARRLLQERLEP